MAVINSILLSIPYTLLTLNLDKNSWMTASFAF